MKSKLCLWIATAILLITIGVHAQGTAFTYQGRLQDGTNHASGFYDLTFGVWTAATGPAQVGGTVTNLATGVTNGLFAVALDFGGGVFDGSPRWLEIGVRTNGGEMFSKLSPRQPLTATPYAIYAGGVNAAGISGAITANMLAPGAAATNLAASGQGAVPSGAMLVSTDSNATNLMALGYVKSGGYVYLANSWKECVASAAPAGRKGEPAISAVWTGSKMIVWGGRRGEGTQTQYLNDGGCYDQASNTWLPVSTAGSPAPRDAHTAVWTGSQMIIWGGYSYDTSWHFFNDGSRYSPVSNSWSALTTNNAPTPRREHTAVWSGTEMIIWGGHYYDGSQHYLSDGWRYNPASNAWTSMTATGAPSGRAGHAAVWTGTEMIVWGGFDGSTWVNNGGRYDPASDTWRTVSTAGSAFPTSSGNTAIWTGREMIMWCGSSGGRYNPASDSWSTMDNTLTSDCSYPRVWTGSEMIVWGGGCRDGNGASYNPASNTWTPMTSIPRAPIRRGYHAAVWTGSEIIIWGGSDTWGGDLNDTWSCTPPKLLYLYSRP